MKLSWLMWMTQVMPQPLADQTCLATTVYLEARSEPALGQIAVAEVALRRLEQRRWGGTLCQVVKARGQFAKVERLDQIVVRSGIQPLNAVGELVARGQDDDWRVGAFTAQRFQEFEALAIWQMQVEQDEFVGDDMQVVASIAKRGAPVDGMAVGGDMIAHRLAQHGVVFDQQDAHLTSLFTATRRLHAAQG